MTITIFTIASFNYLPQVVALQESLTRTQPDWKFVLFLCDRKEERVFPEALRKTQIISVEDILIPNFTEMVHKYNITELNTAIKPFCFMHIFKKWEPTFAIYIDPDTYCFSPFIECTALVRDGAEIILIPHTTQPVEDRQSPNDYDFAKVGIFNLGFCGVRNSEQGKAFLAWWCRKLIRDCRVDLPNGIFVDQKWCDAAPALFDNTQILRHEGYNVAYWNLVHRPIRKGVSGWISGDQPLRFFHFSGLDMLNYKIISKHQDRLSYDNIGVGGQELFLFYKCKLMSLQYFDFFSQPCRLVPPLAFTDQKITSAYYDALRRLTPNGGRKREPSIEDFWNCELHRRANPNCGFPISDFLFCILHVREDLAASFDFAKNDDAARAYHQWALTNLQNEMPLVHFDTSEFLRASLTILSGAPDELENAIKRFFLVAESVIDPWSQESRHPHGVPMPAFLELYVETRPDLARTFDLTSKIGRRNALVWFGRHFEKEVGTTDTIGTLAKCIEAHGVSWPHRRNMIKTGSKGGLGDLPQFEKGRRSAETFALFNDSNEDCRDLQHGVTLIGYPHAQMGMGEHIRNTAQALDLVKIEYDVFSFDPGLKCGNNDRSLDGKLSESPSRQINIFHINADQTLLAYQIFGPAIFDKRYNIGYWVWELEVFPEAYRAAIDLMDEMWVPSQFVQNALRRCTSKPIYVMPLRVEIAADHGLEVTQNARPFTFLFYFDFHSFHQRKNPAGLIEAFLLAFPVQFRDNVKLTIKAIGTEQHLNAYSELRRLAASDSRITFIDKSLSSSEMANLIRSASCFVSLHRSEGFGRGMAEAMALGKPVIATGYSGNVDYMNADNSYLVNYNLVDVQSGEYVLPSGARWALPDIRHAADLMRSVFEDPQGAARKGKMAAKYMAENHSTRVVAERLASRIALLPVNSLMGSNRTPEAQLALSSRYPLTQVQ